MGVITATLLGSLVGTAFASGKLTTINVVQGGIKLLVFGSVLLVFSYHCIPNRIK